MEVNNINQFVGYLCNKDSSSFVVTSSANKTAMLKLIDSIDKIVPVKIITVQEFYQSVIEVKNLSSFYHHGLIKDLSIANQRLFLKHAMYVDLDANYETDKLKILQGLKKDLEIVTKDCIKNKHAYIYEVEDQFIVDYFDTNTIVENGLNVDTKGVFYEFKDVYSEVFYQVDKVAKLLQSGVNVNEVAVVCPTNEYIKYCRVIFDLYNIPVKYSSDGRSIYATNVGSEFIKLINNYSFSTTVDMLIQEFPNEQDVIKKIIKIVNKYHDYHEDLSYVITYIIHDFKNTKIDQVNYQDCVGLITIYDAMSYQHVFVLGFNNKVLLKMRFDDDFLTDKERQTLNLSTSNMLNEHDKHRVFSLLCNDNVKSISYAKVSSEGELSISNLNMMFKESQVIKINDIVDTNSLSMPAHQLLFSELHDSYVKFNTQCSDLSTLNNSISLESKTSVGTRGIEKIDEIGKVRLSSSSLESYFSCEYRFYLERILKLSVANTYDWHLVIGNYIHYILEHVIDQDSIDKLNVEKYAKEYLQMSERAYSVEELFYLEKIIDEIVLIANIIDNQFNDCSIIGLEKSIDFDIDEQFSFSGKIDKVLADRDNQLVIVDYKTGDSKLDFNNIKHGLGMQNMIYLYLMHQIDDQFKLAGTFRQNIKPKLVKAVDFKNYEESYRVSGFIDKNQLMFIEQNLSTLKCQTKKDGSFWSRSNTLVDQQEINELEKVVIEKINEAIKSISSNRFRINPKKNKDIDSCKYCKYQEICLKKDTTYQHI